MSYEDDVNSFGYPDDPEYTGRRYFDGAVPPGQRGLTQLGDNNNDFNNTRQGNNTRQDYSGFNPYGNLTRRGENRRKPAKTNNKPIVRIKADIEEERAAAEASAEKKKKMLTRGGLMAVAAILIGLLAKNRLHPHVPPPTFEELKTNAENAQMFEDVVKSHTDANQVCREHPVEKTTPGLLYGSTTKMTQEQMCWMPLTEEYKSDISRVLGAENLETLLRRYDTENKKISGYNNTEITLHQANQIIKMASIRAEKEAKLYENEKERIQSIKDEQARAKAMTEWKNQPAKLPHMDAKEFELLRARVEAESYDLLSNTANNADYTRGGTRRKRHRRRKTKKHHKSKQKKTTRRVRRKHKKRQTRRKS